MGLPGRSAPSQRLWTLLSLFLTFRAVRASQCAAFDSSGNAYVFGTTYGDVSLGSNVTQPATFVSITNQTGRPSFDGNTTQCFTNQFTDGLYVLGGSVANPNDAYIFDFQGQTWSTQTTSGGPSGGYVAILDHDTTTLYAFGNGSLNALAFSETAAKASSSALQWQIGAANGDPPFNTIGYQPVLGAANNHIQFLNTPASSPGDAYIYVIHYAYYQPTVQSFGNFPASHGQTATIFSNSSTSPYTFAFIPDNATSTYIINTQSNTTSSFAAPPFADPLASYAASSTQLLQLTSNGSLAFLDLGAPTNSWTVVDVSNMTASMNSTSANGGTSGSISGKSKASSAVPSQNVKSDAENLKLPGLATIVLAALTAVGYIMAS
ncbi:MAG: hypothetical protein CYPHOPRED_000399 [Cyphobasidiales sp. Tagirdzhanova-0007]|nr:MAG: hypothetical protein CYPHOPRED_000399 [Cyphobasidiales sp. Tagirdzhanova-0007]